MRFRRVVGSVFGALRSCLVGEVVGDEGRRTRICRRRSTRDYCEAYGMDVSRWDVLELFRDIPELRVTCYAVFREEFHPVLRSHALPRVACIQALKNPTFVVLA